MNKNILLLAGVALAILGCGKYKPESVGGARDVLVFTDCKELIESEISFALEKPVYTPQPEPELNVRYMVQSDLESHLTYHGIIFAGLEEDPIIKNNFPKLSANDSFALYKIEDPWAKKQKLLVFVARDTTALLLGLKAVREKIYETFKYQLLERLEAMTYESGTDAKLAKEIEKFGFKVKVPRYWLLDKSHAEERFIWIHTHEPDRSIFVYWEPNERADLSRRAMIGLRDSLTRRFYQGDYLDSVFLSAGPSYFRGQNALEIEGVWQNDSMMIGGPMKAYAFNEDGRFYMVDAMLFYPAAPKKKLFWLNQLEVVIATFEPLK